MTEFVTILFLFALGSCIGSFLNVVVWRLPRGASLVSPPSHCPQCQHRLAWYDNVPVLGWIFLRGRCRYCRTPISPRYPLVEAATGLLFVLYYLLMFRFGIGPCATVDLGEMTRVYKIGSFAEHWPVYMICMLLLSALLAASLIDAELFIIPIEIPWLIAGVAVLYHAIMDRPAMPGTLNVGPAAGALSAGAAIGLLVSFIGWKLGRIPTSFPQGEPLLEIDRADAEREIAAARRRGEQPPPLPPPYTPGQIRLEMVKEMLFLTPPLLLGGLALLLYLSASGFAASWDELIGYYWFSGLLGALLGGMTGGFVVWLARILGTLGFGRVAMGLGDVHLMVGIGAVLGAGGAVITFFLAPFFGLLLALYMLISGKRRELPYGPYLSLGAAATILFYCPIAAHLRPGLQGLVWMLTGGH